MPRYELEYPIQSIIQPHVDCGYSRKKSGTEGDRLAWWREARFGMFVHWGLYSIPAGIWRGKEYKFISEWIMHQAKIPIAEYQQLAAEFDPKSYDPEAWVQLALDAGAKYLVITAKHHDGFAMFNTSASDWNAVQQTPSGQDLLAPLAEACHRGGLRLGFYYSQDVDWHDPHGAGNDWDYPPNSYRDTDRFIQDKVKPQLKELLSNYGPVSLLWFDTPMTLSQRHSVDLTNYVHSLQPDCLISGRIGHGVGDFGSLEDNSIPNGPVDGDWEMPATMNDSWGFKALDENWKSPGHLIRQFADLAGRGANYLLNVGPDADGLIPYASVQRMRIIGDWLKKYGEAIYGTRANPFPSSFPWGTVTQGNNKLYLLIDKWPKGGLKLQGLRTRTLRAYCLESPRDDLSFEQNTLADNNAPYIDLELPDLPPDPYVSCVVLEIEGKAIVEPYPIQDEWGRMVIPAHVATIDNPKGQGLARVGFSGLIENWKNPETIVSCDFITTHGGEFDVWVVSGCVSAHVDWQGFHQVSLDIANQRLFGELTPDKDTKSRRSYYFPEKASFLGRVILEESGKCNLTMTLDKLNGEAVDGLCLVEIRLEPVR